jgi:rhomboid protease GluP
MRRRISYNSPVVLTFALICLGVLLLGLLTKQRSTALLFSVYRAPLTDLLTYPRFFLHVLGHSGWSHYLGNMLMLLIVGPPLEEKYGGKKLVLTMAITALVSGLVQFVFFPGSALLGASGIVFMMIVLLSMTDMRSGRIPVTLILVLIFYIGREAVNGFALKDNVSQITHIVGGACGAVAGFILNRRHRRS